MATASVFEASSLAASWFNSWRGSLVSDAWAATGLPASAWCVRTPAPPASRLAVSIIVVIILALVRNMALVTPAAKVATCAGTIPAAVPPAATKSPDRTVALAGKAGTPALPAFSATAKAANRADSSTPRRAKRCCRRCRARVSRLDTVPSWMPSSAAASAPLLPSKAHSTKAARKAAGRRSISSSRIACTSSQVGLATVLGSKVRTRVSWFRRRAAFRFASIAVRYATPCSHSANASGLRIDPVFCARTRKVAWKLSSASCSWLSTRRQTRSTIGPWRATNVEKAASSRLVEKSSNSCRSLAAACSRVPPACGCVAEACRAVLWPCPPLSDFGLSSL